MAGLIPIGALCSPQPLLPMQAADDVVDLLRSGRDEILRDWMDRVRDNRATEVGQALSDPLLLNHVPQLFDALLDRLATSRTRQDAEQFAAVHGFSRRVTGYDVVEMTVELMMLRRAIWTYLTIVDPPINAAYAAMERIDGMVDRAVITSLRAFLDPSAGALKRTSRRPQTSDAGE